MQVAIMLGANREALTPPPPKQNASQDASTLNAAVAQVSGAWRPLPSSGGRFHPVTWQLVVVVVVVVIVIVVVSCV